MPKNLKTMGNIEHYNRNDRMVNQVVNRVDKGKNLDFDYFEEILSLFHVTCIGRNLADI